MKKRIFGLRAKFAVLFLLFAVIIMFSVGAVTYRTYRSSMMKRYASEAVTIAKLAASYLDGDELVRYSITRERVADSQFVFSISEQNFSGCPNAGSCFAMFFHRLQQPLVRTSASPFGAWF